MIDVLRKYAALAEGAMSYLEWENRPGPALLFTHANGFNAETYRALLEPLADRFQVFACDQRGYGFSTLPATPGLMKGWTIFRDDLTAFLARVTDKPVILAGHSMGATVSLMVAAAQPAKVAALVLVEPVLAPWSAGLARFLSYFFRGDPSPSLARRALQRRSEFASLAVALEAYRGRGAFKTWPEEMLVDYLKGGLLPDGKGAVRLACAPAWEAETFRTTPLGVASAVRAIRCPLTILRGTIASTTWESEIARIVRRRPDTRIVRVDGASHFLPMEKPEIVRAEIVRMAELVGTAAVGFPSPNAGRG
jgi:pimeloyl-ACP methyl ester carboxylesterase